MCTPVSSKDHTYSFAECLVTEAQQAALAVECSAESPVDEVYDFGEIYCDSEVSSSGSCEVSSDVDSQGSRSSRSPVSRNISRHSWMKPDDDVDDDEQRRLEGVRALMNLASATKADRVKKSHRLPLSRSLWTKAVRTQKKQNKRLGRVQKKKVNKNKAKKVKKVMRRRTR